MSKSPDLYTLAGIRDGAKRILELAQAGGLKHFDFHPGEMHRAVAAVLACLRREYRSVERIPWHSRWVHLDAAPDHVKNYLKRHLADLTPKERLQTNLELVTLSVLLDGGAGATWKYIDAPSNQTFRRSEGLAVASLSLFLSMKGRIDANSLNELTPRVFDTTFQVTEKNKLEGGAARLALLQKLGALAREQSGSDTRIGAWLEEVLGWSRETKTLSMEKAMNRLIGALRVLWREGQGDIGVIGGEAYPFHKLILWLGYSLGDTLRRDGTTITELEKVPGLAEYRNGGLFVDSGILIPKDAKAHTRVYEAGDPFTVEWRAMTVGLLERIATELRRELDVSEKDLPMTKVLQAGTWQAGREVAAQTREGGVPPFRINTQGILF